MGRLACVEGRQWTNNKFLLGTLKSFNVQSKTSHCQQLNELKVKDIIPQLFTSLYQIYKTH